jgi:PPK2 family polyphosphate:nucleotide phosphotransferase
MSRSQDQSKNHFKAVDSPYLVPDDGSFRVKKAATDKPDDAPDKDARKDQLTKLTARLDELQHTLYAESRRSVLLVFQAMDAAGKDSTIRAVLSGVDPAGCAVHSFKRPTPIELDHDFLWRTTCKLPERGQIGVFNRSHYEEVLVTKVHPEYLDAQKLPKDKMADRWAHRYESIREHEKHLARSGTVILKFWLNVSREEQRQRFLSRLEEPEKNWKFEAADIAERARWADYMKAYEDALNETSRPWAPWYAIPADSKSFMRMTVADIVVRTLESLKLEYPVVDDAQRARFAALKKQLEAEAP